MLLSLTGGCANHLLGVNNFQQTSDCSNMFQRNRFFPKCIAAFFSLHVDCGCGDDLSIFLRLFDNYDSDEYRDGCKSGRREQLLSDWLVKEIGSINLGQLLY